MIRTVLLAVSQEDKPQSGEIKILRKRRKGVDDLKKTHVKKQSRILPFSLKPSELDSAAGSGGGRGIALEILAKHSIL